METGTVTLIALAVAAGALVQGLSGLGFALVCAPIVTQIVPGTSGVGLVNALSIVQNGWLIARTDGQIAWPVLRRLVPGLVIGVLLGWLALQALDPAWYRVVVAASACGSIGWLLLAGRFRGPVAGLVSAIWAAAVNTVAAVGGPPIAAYLVTRGLDFPTYVRTLQVVFAALSLVSLPLLGVTVPSIGAVAVWVTALVAGSAIGELLRRHLAESTAQQVGRAAIVIVCVAALALSLLSLRTPPPS